MAMKYMTMQKLFIKRCDYGYGSDKDGIMFIVSMAERRSELIAFGYGNTALTDLRT